MTASEFAFLAFGLILGVASGAALIEVLRARPPASRPIKVTVAPNAIQGRLSATLADPTPSGDAAGPAPLGPGDRRLGERPVVGEPVAPARRLATLRPSSRTPVPSGPAARPAEAVIHPDPLWLRPAASAVSGGLVPVPMSLEPDPITNALRATAAATAVAAMAAGTRARTGSVAVAAAEPATDRLPPVGDGDGPRGSLEPPDAPGAADPSRPSIPEGPCADERRVSEERCAVAVRAREGQVAAADALRGAQRTYDDLVTRAEEAAAASDPRAVRAAKEEAQQRFHSARAMAKTHDDVESGARAWLAEINQINQETREAAQVAERSRAAAIQLAPNLERLSVEADAARIAAERADEACIAAREAVAACDEARQLAAAATGPGSRSGSGSGWPDDDAADDASPRIAAATPEPEDEFAFSSPMRSSARADARILRILRGEGGAILEAATQLGGDDAGARASWQARITALAEALVARSIEATAFEFPMEHFFWGPFSQAQNRDIAAALASLGFRSDGLGGWVDERVPSQRDLSLAVGYAGLDPMRVRHWPTDNEMQDLLSDVRVAADEYVAGAAGGMSLGELVTLLGRRADGLTDLWNDWGRIRPVLLEAS